MKVLRKKLLEICKDFDVLIKSPKTGKISKTTLAQPVNIITSDDLRAIIGLLNQRYPTKAYYTESVTVTDNGECEPYWIFSRKDPTSRPFKLYIHTTKGIFKVEEEDVRRDLQFVAIGLQYRLWALGVKTRTERVFKK